MEITALADWVTIIAFPFTIIGIGITLWQIHQTKSAAESAQDAARLTSEKVDSFQTVANISRQIEKLKNSQSLLLDGELAKVAELLVDIRDLILEFITKEDQKEGEFNRIAEQLTADIYNLRAHNKDEESEIDISEISKRIDRIHQLFVIKQTKIKNK